MAFDEWMQGYGNESAGTVIPRIMWSHAHRRDRVPDFWPLSHATSALPNVDPPLSPDVATIVIVFTEEERTYIA